MLTFAETNYKQKIKIMDMDKVILTDEELKEVAGGGAVGSTDNYCEQYDTAEDCNKNILCQWGQFKCHAHPRANSIRK